MIDVEKLKQVAIAATRGEWDWHQGVNAAGEDFVTVETAVDTEILLWNKGNDTSDVEFIAAANPSAVLELITRLESAELFAELAKQSEPVGYFRFKDGEWRQVISDEIDLRYVHKNLFTHPLPQPDLVAEIERLVKALEDFISAYDSEPSYERQCTTRLALESMRIAIAAHKARKEKV